MLTEITRTQAKILVKSTPLKKSNSGRKPTMSAIITENTTNLIRLQISQTGFSSINLDPNTFNNRLAQ